MTLVEPPKIDPSVDVINLRIVVRYCLEFSRISDNVARAIAEVIKINDSFESLNFSNVILYYSQG